MSTKSTIMLLPCTHIYREHVGANGEETFVIEVAYGHIEDDTDYIEVEHDSDFAKLMRYLLKGKTEEELQAVIRGKG